MNHTRETDMHHSLPLKIPARNSDWCCHPNKKKVIRARNLYLILRRLRRRIFFGRLQYSNNISVVGKSGGNIWLSFVARSCPPPSFLLPMTKVVNSRSYSSFLLSFPLLTPLSTPPLFQRTSSGDPYRKVNAVVGRRMDGWLFE